MSMTCKPDSESSFVISREAGLLGFLALISFASTYPALGEPLPLNMKIDAMFFALRGVYIEPWKGYAFWYDRDNKTIRVYLGGAELAPGAAYPASMENINLRADGWRS